MIDTLIIISATDSGYTYQANPALSGLSVVIAIITIVGIWATFVKAGHPGWAAIIPIYNTYTLVKTAGRPGWWTILLFIPIVNIFVAVVVALDVARRFGKGGAFGFFLLFVFSFIGYPMLGFGGARYDGASALR